MVKILHIDEEIRPDSGPLQFGNDWPGIFLRGDDSLHYACILKTLLDSNPLPSDPISIAVLHGLYETLLSCQL